MSRELCPSCGDATTRALNISVSSVMQYYRCDGCGHVWIVFTDGRPIHHVTPLTDKPQSGAA